MGKVNRGGQYNRYCEEKRPLHSWPLAKITDNTLPLQLVQMFHAAGLTGLRIDDREGFRLNNCNRPSTY